MWRGSLILFGLLPLVSHGVETRWVHGSWVNVRESGLQTSVVRGQVSTNTQVSLLAVADKSCEIETQAKLRGFVPCNLLGTRPLRLSELAYEQINDKPNPQYSPPRAFWVSPSMAALFAAGQHFQRTLLSKKQYNLEIGHLENGACCADTQAKPPALVRYPVPEFEAMKAVLAQGVIAGKDLDPPLLSCAAAQAAGIDDANYGGYPQQLAEKHPFIPWIDAFSCRVKSLPALSLPPIRPSLLKSEQDILPASASLEQISGRFNILEKGQTIGAPRWILDYDVMRYNGAWDIGSYHLRLQEPIIEYAVGRNGLIAAYQNTLEQRFTPHDAQTACSGGFSDYRPPKNLLSGYPSIKNPLFSFRVKNQLPINKATIKARSINASAPKNADANAVAYSKAVIYEIDLDNDNVADFVQWDLSQQEEGGNSHVVSHRLFININGVWHPFAREEFEECT